jgi:uncharacterized protein YgiM (DUF1202 family)
MLYCSAWSGWYMKFIAKILCLLLLFSTPAGVIAQESPPVLAFYYAWFDQNTWSSGQSVDRPAQPYNSADRATIERHVMQAQGAGIDAFIQAWYGPQVEGNQTETNFRILLEIAQARGFKAAVDFETTSPFLGSKETLIQGLASLLATHTQHPGYLRYQGKPVIFFWRQQQFSVDTWLDIRNQVDPGRTTFWIAEGTDLSYQAVFDGHHLYSIAWAASPAAQLTKWADQVRAYETEHQVDRLWAATVMPGYNDTNLPRSNAFTVARRDGAYYRETWQGALASQPDMIIVTSFNEWPEGTHIEPSASYGNFYLDMTRELVTSLRGSPPPNPVPAVPAAQESQETPPQEGEVQEAPPDGPYIETSSITNVRSGPATTFDLVGRLAAGETVTVIGRLESSDWWQIEFEVSPDGKGWVAAEVVDFVGDVSTVPVVEAPAPPPAEATPTATGGEVETPVAPEVGTDEPEADTQSAETGATIQVPAGGVNVRRGPDLTFELLGRLEEDATVVVVAKNEAGDWWQIEYEAAEDGLGWVAAAVVDFTGNSSDVPVASDNSQATETPVLTLTPTLTPTPAGPVGTIQVQDAINVRAEPSVDGMVLGGLFPGQTADVLAISEDGDWWQIDFPESPDQPAWVAAEFVRFEGDEARVPIFGVGIPTPTVNPTDTPTITPTPTPFVLEQPTFAPTATSVFEATSAALLANRGTPDPSLTELPSERESAFSWNSVPWGLLSVLVIIGFFWYQFIYRRRR